MATAVNLGAIPQPVSPVLRSPVGQQALRAALLAQNRYDPYALTKGMQSFSNDYDAMNRNIATAVAARGGMLKQNALEEAGYYPAYGENQTTALLNQNENIARRRGGEQDVEAAFQAALAKLGPQAIGTPAFEFEMLSHMHTNYAATAHAPKIAKAREEAQIEMLQHGMLKTGLENMLARRYAQEYYDSKKAEVAQAINMSPTEQASAIKKLQAEAIKHGQEQVLQDNVQVTKDPTTGVWMGLGRDGETVQFDPRLLAAAMKAGGNSKPWDAYDATYKARIASEAVARANAVAASTIGRNEAETGLKEAQTAAGGYRPATPSNKLPPLDPRVQARILAAKSDWDAAKQKFNKKEADPLVQKSELDKAAAEVAATRKAYLDAVDLAHGHGYKLTDVGTVEPAVPTNTTADTEFPTPAMPMVGTQPDLMYPQLYGGAPQPEPEEAQTADSTMYGE